MGSFRSQPELTKHSQEKRGAGLTFATTHMCGTRLLIQVGGSTWKMRTSVLRLSPIRRTPYSECSTATEVLVFSYRPRSVYFCGAAFHLIIRKKSQLPQEIVLKGPQGNFPEDGRPALVISRKKIDSHHPKRDEIEGQWTQIRGVVPRRLHRKRSARHP